MSLGPGPKVRLDGLFRRMSVPRKKGRRVCLLDGPKTLIVLRHTVKVSLRD